MLNQNIKKITAISMLAFTIGISGASASTADLSNEAKAYGEKLAEKTYFPEKNTDHPYSKKSATNQKPIKFSMAWVRSLSIEELEAIDFSQVDYTEHKEDMMKKLEAPDGGRIDIKIAKRRLEKIAKQDVDIERKLAIVHSKETELRNTN